MSDSSAYIPPKVWTWEPGNGGAFASINRPIAGPTHDKVLPVGNYAVRLVCDDSHDTGIFTWAFLSELGEAKEERWAEYIAELADKGMSRIF